MAGAGGSQLGRSWRRFRRRPVGVQVIPVVVVIVLVVAISLAASGGSHPTATTTTTTAVLDSKVTPPDEASTSSAGVTAHTINVVFPVSNLSTLAANFGFAGDVEYDEQAKAINLFVKTINDAGGINGRKINAEIVDFDPTNEVGMRALCKQWTEGGASVFAVLDGIGTWTGDNQLCITQEGPHAAHQPVDDGDQLHR